MLASRIAPPHDVLAATALEATGGGTLLMLDAQSARPGLAEAAVLRDGELLHVTLDARLGTAVVVDARAFSAPRARPSRRCAPALR